MFYYFMFVCHSERKRRVSARNALYIIEEEILRLAPQDDKTGVTGVTFSYIHLMSTLYNLHVYTSFIFLVYNMYTPNIGFTFG